MKTMIGLNEDLHRSWFAGVAGTEAFGLWVLSVCYVVRNQTAGFYPAVAAERWDPTGDVGARIVEHGYWTPAEGGWIVENVPSPIDGKPAWRVALSRSRIPDALRLLVYARDRYTCQSCGATDDLTLDHIWPRSRGGQDVEGNLRVLCRPCNSSKGAKV